MQVLFFIAFGLMAYSYFIFPAFMFWLAKKEQGNVLQSTDFLSKNHHLPTVAIVLAAYNEAAVLERKIRSSFATHYPENKLTMYVGLDSSTDASAQILERLQAEFPSLHCTLFEQRTGKPQIINKLIKNIQADVLVMTDADTFFDENTLTELLKPFENAKVGGVQGHLVSSSTGVGGVEVQELAYNSRELRTKQGEGVLGVVMGAHGACYALRRGLYVPVPQGFSVDDFFVVMQILKQNYKVVYAPLAVCSMQISGLEAVQFGRKRRMAAGNYQNLWYFWSMLLPHYGVRSWVFWSHKVVRWFGWLLLLVMLVSAWVAAMAGGGAFWVCALLLQMFFYTAVITDYFLDYYLGVCIKPLRSVRHFVNMNYAMLCGFIDFLRHKTVDKWNN
jgi:cellulose synthase/poly-beta-1,6-N-acetylglucosamine synthase-like glycosyltransferase